MLEVKETESSLDMSRSSLNFPSLQIINKRPLSTDAFSPIDSVTSHGPFCVRRNTGGTRDRGITTSSNDPSNERAIRLPPKQSSSRISSWLQSKQVLFRIPSHGDHCAATLSAVQILIPGHRSIHNVIAKWYILCHPKKISNRNWIAPDKLPIFQISRTHTF